jgi:hypothetical protein
MVNVGRRISVPFEHLWTNRSIYSAYLRAQLWVLLVGLFAFALLAAPAQVVELYRITHADGDFIEPLRLIVALFVMAAALWSTAELVLAMSARRIAELQEIGPFARVFPFLLASLPFIGAAIGHFLARPEDLNPKASAAFEQAGSPWLGAAQDLAETLGIRLPIWTAVLAVLSIAILAIGLRRRNVAQAERWARWSLRAERPRAIVIVLCIILATDLLFVISPVVVPRLVGTFLLAALFVLATAINAALLTTLSNHWRVPLIPLLIGAAILFSAFDLNDDHHLRNIPDGAVAGDHLLQGQFKAWYESRPDHARYGTDYPVYIVSAQGGGIYAAYQAAVTLARIQDRCPVFKDHVFVISGVSGGSVGAALFASLLPPTPTAEVNGSIPPTLCRDMYKLHPRAGPLEQKAATSLLDDHLSPLVAGTFFPDFTQRFLPFAIPGFDRARFLETSLEISSANVADGAAGLGGSLRASWTPTGSRPALMLNTTDAGSGLRFTLSPLIVDSGATDTNRTLRSYPLYRAGADMRLSTAAVTSARFPWVTPAATISNDLIGQDGMNIRLVDGGYVDNSGVETALDMIDALSGYWSVQRKAADGRLLPKPHFILLAITTSDVPERTSLAMGETAEPIRALLSTRTSRAVIALDRAKQRMPYKTVDGLPGVLAGRMRLSDARPISLSGRFYDLPLGWRLSARTADMIGQQSGDLRNCVATANYVQLDPYMPDADCVVSTVAAELRGALPRAMLQAVVRNYRPVFKTGALSPGLPTNEVLQCISKRMDREGRADESPGRRRRGAMSRAQADQAEWLLNAWRTYPSDSDPRWLAFVLAVANYNSADMTLTTEQGTPEHFIDVYGPKSVRGRALGNRTDEDAVRFVGRGYPQLTGRENYAGATAFLGIDLLTTPELLNNADISSRALFWYLIEKNGARVKRAIVRSDWEAAWAVSKKSEAPGAAGRVAPFLDCIDANRRRQIITAR